MIVVSDTSPLNYRLLIQHAEVLPLLFGRVIAPPAVMIELQHPGAPSMVRAWAAGPPAWLEIRAPATIAPNLGLGIGETHAISLAQELHADAVLIDELDLAAALAALRQTTFRVSDQILDDLLLRDADRQRQRSGDSDGGDCKYGNMRLHAILLDSHTRSASQ